MSCYLVTWPTGARALICGRCESAEDYGAASVVMASPSDVGPDAECQWCRALLDEGGDLDDAGEPCEECERSNGPRFKGRCIHG